MYFWSHLLQGLTQNKKTEPLKFQKFPLFISINGFEQKQRVHSTYIDLDNYASNCVVKVNIKVVTKHRKILVTHFLQVTENLIKIVSEILLKVKTKFTAPHQR